jgi:hypothetical protein
VRGDNQPRPLGRIGELRFNDRGQRQVAKRATAVPALVASLGNDDLGSRLGVEIRQRREPIDAREAMTLPTTTLGI